MIQRYHALCVDYLFDPPIPRSAKLQADDEGDYVLYADHLAELADLRLANERLRAAAIRVQKAEANRIGDNQDLQEDEDEYAAAWVQLDAALSAPADDWVDELRRVLTYASKVGEAIEDTDLMCWADALLAEMGAKRE